MLDFRRYKKKQGGKVKKRHPKLIVDDYNNKFGFMGLTEQKNKGKHHRNIPLSVNPKKNDMRPAYLRRSIEYDNKENFGKVLDNYKLSDKDKKFVIEYVEKHKKR